MGKNYLCLAVGVVETNDDISVKPRPRSSELKHDQLVDEILKIERIEEKGNQLVNSSTLVILGKEIWTIQYI